jgi:hypothetical protein
MPKYHLNAAGDPGVCRARTRACPFGEESEHYLTKEEARETFEKQQELLALIDTGARHSLNQAAEEALASPLTPLPKQPEWVEDLTFRLQQELFGVTPQVLATVDSPLGPLAVVWEAATVESNDIFSQVEEGYRIPRAAYRTLSDGELVGYVKAAYMTPKSVQDAFGDDEWRGFRYLRYRESFYAMEMEHPEDRDYSPDQSADELPRSVITPPPLESEEELRSFVASAQQHLRSYSEPPPRSMGESALREELARLQAAAAAHLDAYTDSFATPSIDQSRFKRDELRGHGLSTALYIVMARKLAEQEMALQASGLQTKDAKKAWARMAAEPRLPVKVQNSLYRKGEVRTVEPHYLLDFR